MDIHGKNFIGNTLSAKGSSNFCVFDAESNAVLDGNFVVATEEEVNAATALAHEASSSFAEMPDEERASFLESVADEIMALGALLESRACAETGLPLGRIQGERGRTCFQLRSFATLIREGSWREIYIDTAEPARAPIPKPDLRKRLEAIGPILVFGASNFPLAYSVAGGDTAAALAAGNPVIVKSHPAHPGTSELVASAIISAAAKTNMPNGVFSMLNDQGIEIGKSLVMHPQIKGVGFTGSLGGGRAILDMAAKRPEPIPVFAEMGSINPMLFLPGALKAKGQEWAKTMGESITLGAGQFCTNPGLMVALKAAELDDFSAALAREIEKATPATMLNKGICANYSSKKKTTLSLDGVETLSSSSKDARGNQGMPSLAKVSGEKFLSNPACQEEVFGPFSLLVVCDNADELKRVISSINGQLTGSVIGDADDLANFNDVISIIRSKVGRIIFNGVPTGVEVCGAMNHGGPYPASTDSRFTSVGPSAIKRFVRPVAYQNCPQGMLPKELKDENPKGIFRNINGTITQDPV